MQTITVRVTEDILRQARGENWSSSSLMRWCIYQELASWEVGLVRPYVEIHFSRHTPFPPKKGRVLIPDDVAWFMCTYDVGEPVAPFSFDLEIPDWVQLR